MTNVAATRLSAYRQSAGRELVSAGTRLSTMARTGVGLAKSAAFTRRIVDQVVSAPARLKAISTRRSQQAKGDISATAAVNALETAGVRSAISSDKARPVITALAKPSSIAANLAQAVSAKRPAPAMPSAMQGLLTRGSELLSALPGLRLPGLRRPGLAIAGLAAVILSVVFLDVGSSPTTPVANASLTFPIPERPAASAFVPSPESPADDIASDDIAEEDIANAGPPAQELAAPTLTAPTLLGPDLSPDAVDLILPARNDPIEEMIDYVTRRAAASTAADANPILAQAGSLRGLSRFSRAAEVVGLEKLLVPGQTYTIFAPNDDAFDQLAPGEFESLLEPAGHERLLTLLSHHILPERMTFDDFAGEVHDVTSLAGDVVTIDATGVIRIADAGMIEADVQAANSVMHIIDKVLPTATP